MVTATDATAIPQTQLKHGALSLPETIGQSIANIAPTLTPALKHLRRRGAGRRRLLARLSDRDDRPRLRGRLHRDPGAPASRGRFLFRLYRPQFRPYDRRDGRLGDDPRLSHHGCLPWSSASRSSWATSWQSSVSASRCRCWWPSPSPSWHWWTYAAYRDIQMSSRVGLVLETISIGIIILITAIVVGKHGTVVDHAQLDIGHLKFGGVMSALTFAVFSFVGSKVLPPSPKKPPTRIATFQSPSSVAPPLPASSS